MRAFLIGLGISMLIINGVWIGIDYYVLEANFMVGLLRLIYIVSSSLLSAGALYYVGMVINKKDSCKTTKKHDCEKNGHKWSKYTPNKAIRINGRPISTREQSRTCRCCFFKETSYI